MASAMSSHLVITILLTIIVFTIIIIPLSQLSAPNCDFLAEQTTLQLKYAIDEVAHDDFLYYTKNDVPTDPSYFKTVPIKLCQRFVTGMNINIAGIEISLPGYAYWLQNFGGFPEYQIYYENFPEPSFVGQFSSLWAENYPWSGGATFSLAFWAAMRGVDIGLQVLTFAKAKALQKSFEFHETMDSAIQTLRYNEMEEFSKNAHTAEETIKHMNEYYGEYSEENAILKIAGSSLTYDVEVQQAALKQSGLLALDEEGNPLFSKSGSNLLSNKPAPVTRRVEEVIKNADGSETIKPKNLQVYVKEEDGKSVFELAEKGDSYLLETGWKEATAVPSEALKQMEDGWKEIGADKKIKLYKNLFQSIDEVAPEDRVTLSYFKNDLRDTNWYKQFEPSWRNRISKIINKLTSFNYKIKTTTLTPIETLSKTQALAENFDKPVWYENVGKELLKNSPKTKSRIVKFFGLVNDDQIQAFHVRDYIRSVIEKTTGTIIYHEDSVSNLFTAMRGVVEKNPQYFDKSAIGSDWNNFWEPLIKEQLNADNPNYYQNLLDLLKTSKKSGTEEAQGILATILAQLTEEELNTRKIADLNRFYKDTEVSYLDWIELKKVASDIEQNKIGVREMGNLIGLLEQNTDTMPIDVSSKLLKLQTNRLVFLRLSAFVVPNSWIQKAIKAIQITEDCQGNSICLYTHNAESPESPYYLEEYAETFSIRSWRPVDPLLKYGNIVSSLGAAVATGTTGTSKKIVAGAAAVGMLQAALMSIPEHPRFYVVSPCFAVAKIWKINYGGEETIFVKPEKVDMKGESSNYCYADQELVNTYMTIWIASDVANAAEAFLSSGAKPLVKTVIGSLDVANFAQIVVEAAVSWPGYPFKDMTYQNMHSEAGNLAFDNLLKYIEKEGFTY